MSTLHELTTLVQHMLDLDKKIEQAEAVVSQLKRDRQVFSREHIPDIMADVGVTELMTAGFKISVEPKYYANISEDRAPDAFKWLRDNNQGSIIKTEISGTFGSGIEDIVDLAVLKAFLAEKEIEHHEKEAVHPQTLKAFVKEQVQSNPNFPTALFGVFVADETVVKSPKQTK